MERLRTYTWLTAYVDEVMFVAGTLLMSPGGESQSGQSSNQETRELYEQGL